MNNDNRFVTFSLPLAIFLHATNALRFIGVERTTGMRVAFVFDDQADQSARHVLEFERGLAVPINAVFASERYLKRLMHGTIHDTKRILGESRESGNQAIIR